MDRVLAGFARVDGDLVVSEAHGVAYQLGMTSTARYDEAYFAKVSAYEDGDIAQAVNAGRCAMLARHMPAGARVFDIGAGSGAFVRDALQAGFDAKGFDVMAGAIERLCADGLYADDPAEFDAVTLWDVIEHLEYPGAMLEKVPAGAFLFVSLPVFEDLGRVRESRHYRPGEHLTYWTARGFIDWAAAYGFRLLEQSTHETDAGRDSIGAFAFRRDKEK